LPGALATTVFAGTPEFSFAQTASDTLATLSSQVRDFDFAGSRATIQELQNLGIVAIQVGTETIPLSDLLAMIDAAEAGNMEPVALAGYFDSLAQNTAQALFVPAVPKENESIQSEGDDNFPAGSTG
jgi:hypothetical protein